MAEPVEIACMIYLRAALPLLKEMVAARPDFAKSIENVNGVVQFEVKDHDILAEHMIFENGTLDVKKGRYENPTINFIFKSPKQMKALFSGGVALPKIKGMTKVGLLIKTFKLLLSLMMLQPTYKVKNEDEKKLKVKLLMYMVPYALRELLRGGDPMAVKETHSMPLRIFQMHLRPDGPSSYFIIKEGKLKPGKGIFTQRKPFVSMEFNDYDTAYSVLTMEKDFVEAINEGTLEILGPSDYYKRVGNLMMRVNSLVQ